RAVHGVLRQRGRDRIALTTVARGRMAREMTMRRLRLGALAAAALIVAGCSGAPAPVPVVGAPVDIAKLAGEWGGDYRNDTNGRTGSIVFKLSAGADTAYGDVVMIPRQRPVERMPAQDPAQGLPVSRVPEVLSIAFVRAEGGAVRGPTGLGCPTNASVTSTTMTPEAMVTFWMTTRRARWASPRA